MSPERHHQPTSDQRAGCSATARRSRRSVVAVLTAGLLAVAGCGGSDDDSSGDAAAASPDTEPAATDAPPATEAPEASEPVATEPATTTSASTTEAESQDPSPELTEPETTVIDGPLLADEWAASMIDAWTAYLSKGAEIFAAQLAAQQRGEHFTDVTARTVAAEVELLDEYAAALDAVADDPALDAAADPLRTVIDDELAATDALRELGEADPEVVRAEWDATMSSTPGELPDTEWGAAYQVYNDDERSARLDAACLDLQDAIGAAGYGLLDCTGSSIEFPPVGEILEAGVHEFTVFAPGLTLDLAQQSEVFEASDYVEVSVADMTGVDFVEIAELADPADFTRGTIPLPDDLGPWLEQVPVTVLGEGTVETSTGPAPYWDLQIDAARAGEMNDGDLFVNLGSYGVNESFGSYKFFGGPPVSDEHFVLVDWDRGDDRILVYSIGAVDAPLVETMQTILAGAG